MCALSPNFAMKQFAFCLCWLKIEIVKKKTNQSKTKQNNNAYDAAARTSVRCTHRAMHRGTNKTKRLIDLKKKITRNYKKEKQKKHKKKTKTKNKPSSISTKSA